MSRTKCQYDFPIVLSPDWFKALDETHNPWHETAEEVEAGLQWAGERARLLRRVRKVMRRRLTPLQRRYVELYFFGGLTYRQVGDLTGTNVSSVHRGVRRSLRKLRQAVQDGELTTGRRQPR